MPSILGNGFKKLIVGSIMSAARRQANSKETRYEEAKSAFPSSNSRPC